jgi:hypothetical protein
MLKLPAGALTSVAGLLLVHGQFVPGLSDLDSQGQILAYAVVLGFAQQFATQYVDRKAQSILNSVPGKEPQPPDQPAGATGSADQPPEPAQAGREGIEQLARAEEAAAEAGEADAERRQAEAAKPRRKRPFRRS